MKIEVLDSAEKDLIDGFKFYENQSTGLGDYFLDSIFSDIESRRVYAGIHALHFGYHRLLSKRFPSPSIIVYIIRKSGSILFWIAAGVPHGREINFRDLRTRAFSRPPKAAAADARRYGAINFRMAINIL
jgi:hypothetical protein